MYEVFIEEPNVNLFTWEYHLHGLTRKEFKDSCGELLEESLLEFENDYGKWSANRGNYDKLSKAVFSAVKAGRPSSKELKKKTLETGARTLALCDEILARDLTKAGEREILDYVDELWRLSVELCYYGFYAVYSDHHNFLLSNELDAAIKRHVNEKRLQKNPQEYWSALTAFTDETIARKENIELFEITAEISAVPQARAHASNSRELRGFLAKNFPEALEKIRAHAGKYCWINYGYNGPAAGENDFLREVADAFKTCGDLNAEIKKLERASDDLRKTQKGLESELGLDAEEKKLFEIARDFGFMKAHRMDVRQKANYVFFDKLFRELERRFGYSVTDFKYATIEEVRELLETGKIKEGAGLKERRKYCVYLRQGDGKEIFTGAEAKRVAQKFVKEDSAGEVVEVHGQVACVGRVKGIAKIVFKVEDIHKVVEGDVLIAPTTVPDFLPAMAKAIAFVTDTGGITCHAAIVAREMNKPCVIGTKKATKVFRDGDLIEVDATTGVVRKLER